MTVEFGVGFTDLDDERAAILACLLVGHGFFPAHPSLGKEHEQLRLRQPVSKAAVPPEHRRNNAIAGQRLQLCDARGNLPRECLQSVFKSIGLPVSEFLISRQMSASGMP